MSRTIPLRRALLWILFSVLLVSGSATVGWTIHRYRLSARIRDPRYTLQVVVQRGGSLPTGYLVEALGLSVDHPTNLFALNLKEMASQLAASPVVASARLSRLLPNGLWIDCTARTPVALLYDYTNTAIDREGRLFPLHPFFTPKRLPEIVLGLPDIGECKPWELTFDRGPLELGLELLEFLSSPPFAESIRVRRIDLSNAAAESYGRRELVVFLEEPVVLRLNLSDYKKGLYNYLVLREELLARGRLRAPEEKPMMIDLRIPNLAFF